MNRAEELFNRIKDGGEAIIDELIEKRESENLFLDFKRAANDGNGSSINNNDRKNLAKAISGFGNSEGGVLVWGIDCSGLQDGADVAHSKFPITNITRFKSWLEGAVSGCTIPAHNGVIHESIDVSNGNGFLVTYIPKSLNAPHQVLIGSNYYYMRAGSDFVHVPHSILAGMFGRRPQPNIFQNYQADNLQITEQLLIAFNLGIIITNAGPGIANDIYCNISIKSIPGHNCSIKPNFSVEDWTAIEMYKKAWSLICHKDYRLPPRTLIQPVYLTIKLLPPFEGDLVIEGILGASNTVSYPFKIHNNKETIESTYLEIIDKFTKQELSEIDKFDYPCSLLGIPEEKIAGYHIV